jgi:molecular chaperone DnaK
MSRTTIDFGIDLGTTNSAIALLKGTTPEVIKNNDDKDITPSAVFIDKRGQVHVGERAKNRLGDESAGDDTFIEFKKRMGTDHQYQFKTAGRAMSPEELSAEVLKDLRGNVQQRLAEDVTASVITVPAAFEQRQCAATKKAGELAGFALCPLLQEPVAAALAYGFQQDVSKAYWLIYDFGGGTFDAAIMKAEDGSIHVINHGGDNYLGGSDIDWAIVEQLVMPVLAGSHNLPDFTRGNQKWRHALARIKHAAEIAKIQLSRTDTAYLERCRIKDADGRDVEVEFKLTRDALVSVAEPIIMKSVAICHRVLKEKNLAPGAIERVILVGGPTLAPYFKQLLESSLGIRLDYSVDPLTVVARGAAVFAATQRLEGKAAQKAAAGQFTVDLRYKPVGPDEDPTVRGEVSSPSGTSVQGFTIEVVNKKTHWRSGKVPLTTEGKFKLNLLAEKGGQNTFMIELQDAKGSKQIPVPDTLTYTIGMAISEQPIINSIAVALANNEPDVFFKKGDPLPAKAKRLYRTTHALKKGQTGDVLRVPVVEGEVELADRNRLLGTLEIKGSSIRRDLPAGTEVEVTLHIDASRIIRAKAYVPMLDEEYEAVIEYNTRAPEHRQLKKEYAAEMARLETLRESADKTEDEKAAAILDALDESGRMAEVEALIDAAKSDPDAANRAERQLLQIKIELDHADDALKWPALVAEAQTDLDALDKLIDAHGSSDQKSQAEKLRQQIDDLAGQKRTDALRKKMEQVLDLHRDVLFAQPGFWLGYFKYLLEQSDKMTDPAAAQRLFNQGHQCINNNNVQGLRNTVAQLIGLLPREIADAVQRGYQSGVLK